MLFYNCVIIYKTTVMKLQQIRNYIINHKKIVNISIICVYVLLILLCSIRSIKSNIYGVNQDFYYSFLSSYSSFGSFVTNPQPLGNLFALVCVKLFKISMVFYVALALLLSAVLITLFSLIVERISKSPYITIASTALVVSSMPILMSPLYIESISFLISTIVFLVTFYFWYLVLNSDYQKRNYILCIVFTFIFLLTSSMPLIFIPLLTLLVIRCFKDRRKLILICCTAALSIVFSITSFTQYSSYRSEYYGYIVEGLVNSLSLPFMYNNRYGPSFDDISLIHRAFFIINSLFIAFVIVATIVLLMYKLVNLMKVDRKKAILYFYLIVFHTVLYIMVLGCIRSISLFALVVPNTYFLLILSFEYGKLINSRKEKNAAMVVGASPILPTILFAVFLLAYKNSTIATDTKNVAMLKEKTDDTQITLICDNLDYYKWKTLIDNNNDLINENNINLINTCDESNIQSVDEFTPDNTFFGYENIISVQSEVNIEQQWITGKRYESVVFTGSNHIFFQLFVPPQYPANTTKIIINGETVLQVEEWKNFIYYDYAIDNVESKGKFFHIEIVSEYTIIPHDYDHSSPDYTPLSIYVTKVTTA